MGEPGAQLGLFVADLEGGGAQRSMLALAGAFAERGHRVDLLVARVQGGLESQLHPALRLIELDAWFGHLPLIRHKKRRWVMSCVLPLAAYLRRERPAALLATSHSVNVAAALAAGLARVPTRLVLRIDSQLSRAPSLAHTRTQRRRVRRARRFFPRADAVVTISKGVAEDVVRVTGIPAERVTPIYNPVVSPELMERAHAPVDHPWFAPGEAPVVLGVGRLVQQKDFATLIRAFARLRSRGRARLLILGEGPERRRLEALASELGVADDVSMPGFVENTLPYMARAGVFALSSAWEGFGRVLVEAMAAGCPVVSTDCPSGPSEILEGGIYGPLVPVADDAALAAALLSVLQRAPEREWLRKRAECFSVQKSVEQYLQVLLG